MTHSTSTAMSLPYKANWVDEEFGREGMDIPIDDGLVTRYEDESAYLFREGEREGKRLSWGRNDHMNPEYKPACKRRTPWN